MRRRHINKGPYKKQNVLVVLVEGETEENYLNYLKSIYNKKIRLEIMRKSKMKRNIYEEIRLYSKQKHIKPQELILLYDLENDPYEYDKFIHRGHLKHRNTYLVQPCLEFHFLMHYEDMNLDFNQRYHPDTVYKMLLSRCPGYHKGKRFNWTHHGVFKHQIEIARNRSITTFKDVNQKSFSMLGQLIEDYFIQ